MTKFQYTGQPADYPTLGFSVTTSGAILNGALSSPPLVSPPDARWAVYGGGSGETGITRSTVSPGGEPSPAEPIDGSVLRYSDEQNTYLPSTFGPGEPLVVSGLGANMDGNIILIRGGDGGVSLQITGDFGSTTSLTGVIPEECRPASIYGALFVCFDTDGATPVLVSVTQGGDVVDVTDVGFGVCNGSTFYFSPL